MMLMGYGNQKNEPKLATKERLDKMNGEDLVVVLTKQPQLAAKCDLRKLR